MIKKTSISGNGFTILETIVAILVASLAIAGATTAAREGLRGGSIAKEEVRAFYLAQEVLEALNHKRDSNELSNYVNGTNISWLDKVMDPPNGLCFSGNGCYVDIWDPAGVQFNRCPNNTCPVLRQNQTDYRYGYDSTWAATPYTREVWVEGNPGDQRVLLTINITWRHGTATEQFKTKTMIANWFISSGNE
jgi:type II secretory pathway pseudopilin PulG